MSEYSIEIILDGTSLGTASTDGKDVVSCDVIFVREKGVDGISLRESMRLRVGGLADTEKEFRKIYIWAERDLPKLCDIQVRIRPDTGDMPHTQPHVILENKVTGERHNETQSENS